MPSPFPGMDPYLEAPEVFPGFRRVLIEQILGMLQASLPDSYRAELESDVWAELSASTVRSIGSGRHGKKQAERSRLLLSRVEACAESWLDPDECSEASPLIRIRHRRDELVMSLVVMGPSDWTLDEASSQANRDWKLEVFASGGNLVEIDLLHACGRAGARLRDELRQNIGPVDSHVCVHTWNRRICGTTYLGWLEAPLPRIEIPLRPGDPEVGLDLQAAIDQAYDAGHYRDSIRYDRRPSGHFLSERKLAWIDRRLAAGSSRD